MERMPYQKRNDRRDQMLGYIKGYIVDHGYPPTVREITDAVGLSSTSLTRHYLQALQDEGKIDVEFGKARGLVVLNDHGRYARLVDAAYEAAKDEENKGTSIYGLILALEQLR